MQQRLFNEANKQQNNSGLIIGESTGQVLSKQQQVSNDKLDLYNDILKEQVRELEDEIDMLFQHPRYELLHPYSMLPEGLKHIDWHYEKQELRNMKRDISSTIAGLKQENKAALKALKEVLREYGQYYN